MLIFLLNINKSMVCLEPLIFYFADEDGGDIPQISTLTLNVLPMK